MSNIYYEAGKLGALTKLGVDKLPRIPLDYEEILENPDVPEQTKLYILRDIRKQQAEHQMAPSTDYESEMRKNLGIFGGVGGGSWGALSGRGAKARALKGLVGAAVGGGAGAALGGPLGRTEYQGDLATQERAFEELEHPELMGITSGAYAAKGKKREREEAQQNASTIADALREHHSAYKDQQ